MRAVAKAMLAAQLMLAAQSGPVVFKAPVDRQPPPEPSAEKRAKVKAARKQRRKAK